MAFGNLFDKLVKQKSCTPVAKGYVENFYSSVGLCFYD